MKDSTEQLRQSTWQLSARRKRTAFTVVTLLVPVLLLITIELLLRLASYGPNLDLFVQEESEGRTFFVMNPEGPVGVVGLSFVLLPVPLVLTNPWRLGIMNLVAINAVVVLGLNLIIGYAGQISLGHAAFFGLGAYGSAILSTVGGMPPWIAMSLTAVGVAFTALVIGVPTLRLSGHYLAMATLGFNIVVHHVLVHWDQVTGGPSGLTGTPSFGVPGVTFQGETQQHYLLWAAAIVGLTLSVNFVG